MLDGDIAGATCVFPLPWQYRLPPNQVESVVVHPNANRVYVRLARGAVIHGKEVCDVGTYPPAGGGNGSINEIFTIYLFIDGNR